MAIGKIFGVGSKTCFRSRQGAAWAMISGFGKKAQLFPGDVSRAGVERTVRSPFVTGLRRHSRPAHSPLRDHWRRASISSAPNADLRPGAFCTRAGQAIGIRRSMKIQDTFLARTNECIIPMDRSRKFRRKGLDTQKPSVEQIVLQTAHQLRS